MRRRIAWSAFALLVLLSAAVVGAATFNVEKWSGVTTLPVNPETVDGLVNDPENSYAWAMAEYGDYLYVGTNRNYLRQMFETIYGEGPLPMGLDNVFPPQERLRGQDLPQAARRKRRVGTLLRFAEGYCPHGAQPGQSRCL